MPAVCAQPDAAMEDWQAQRRQMQTLVGQSRKLGYHHVQDLFRLRAEGRWLLLETPLQDTPAGGRYSATVAGVPGDLLVEMVQRKRGAAAAARGPVQPAAFNAVVINFPVPRQMVSLSLSDTREPDQLIVMKRVMNNGGASVQVNLTQSRGPQSNGGGGGGLQLSVVDVAAGGETRQAVFEAPDFLSFLQLHPAETGQYLRPLLRELGQDAVFAPEPTLAWQVFADRWKAKDDAVLAVRAILPKLQDGDYRVRDAALGRLQQLGRDGADVLLHMDRAGLSPEQNARIDRALGPYVQVTSREAARLRADPGFLLDCLYSDDAGLRIAAVDRLRMLFKPDLQFDQDADLVARIAAIDTLRRELVPHQPGGK